MFTINKKLTISTYLLCAGGCAHVSQSFHPLEQNTSHIQLTGGPGSPLSPLLPRGPGNP